MFYSMHSDTHTHTQMKYKSAFMSAPYQTMDMEAYKMAAVALLSQRYTVTTSWDANSGLMHTQTHKHTAVEV